MTRSLCRKGSDTSGLTQEEEEVFACVEGENDVSTIIDLTGMDSYLVSSKAEKVRGIVVRPGCVYGKQGGLTGHWFAGPSRGQSPLVIGDGTNHRPMIHVDDLAWGYLKVVEGGRCVGIISSGDLITILERLLRQA